MAIFGNFDYSPCAKYPGGDFCPAGQGGYAQQPFDCLSYFS